MVAKFDIAFESLANRTKELNEFPVSLANLFSLAISNQKSVPFLLSMNIDICFVLNDYCIICIYKYNHYYINRTILLVKKD